MDRDQGVSYVAPASQRIVIVARASVSCICKFSTGSLFVPPSGIMQDFKAMGNDKTLSRGSGM